MAERRCLTCGMHWRPACEMVDCRAARDAAMLGDALAPSRWCSKSRTAARAMRRSPFSMRTLRNIAVRHIRPISDHQFFDTHQFRSPTVRMTKATQCVRALKVLGSVDLRTGGVGQVPSTAVRAGSTRDLRCKEALT